MAEEWFDKDNEKGYIISLIFTLIFLIVAIILTKPILLMAPLICLNLSMYYAIDDRLLILEHKIE